MFASANSHIISQRRSNKLADKSAIEWTDASWNPATGCDKVSPGCKECYAEEVAIKMQKWGKKKYENGFAYTQHENELDKPLRWKAPRRIFVNSMSDLFHEKATFSFINLVFETMMLAKQHTYQILTKRPERMLTFVDWWLGTKDLKQVPSHIWLGVSVEMQAYTDRIRILRNIPCKIRFVSFEPLLEEVYADLRDIDWAIVGGESGRNHRHFDKQWAYTVMQSCRLSCTAFFFKQWGGRSAKSGGRELDGKTYDEYPRVEA